MAYTTCFQYMHAVIDNDPVASVVVLNHCFRRCETPSYPIVAYATDNFRNSYSTHRRNKRELVNK